MDGDGTPESRALLARFEGSGRFQLVATLHSEQEVQNMLDRGDAHAVVRVLPNFARDLARGQSAEVQVLLDGTNSNTASLVSAYAAGVIGGLLGRCDAETEQERSDHQAGGPRPGGAPCIMAQRRCRARASGSTRICAAATTSCRAWR